MIIAIDVGNSLTGIAVFKEQKNAPEFTCQISTNVSLSQDELELKLESMLKKNRLSFNKLTAAILASVVPAIDDKYFSLLAGYHLPAFKVDVSMKTGLEFRYDNEKDIGSDRIVNSVAAAALYRDKGDLLIIDFGTATTFCLILKDKIFQGGVIAPGLNMFIDSLAAKTAALPRVEFSKPDFVIGTSTITNLQSGVYYGFASMVQGLISLIQKQFEKSFFVIITGGHCKKISPALEVVHTVEEFLTFKGLKILFDMNRR